MSAYALGRVPHPETPLAAAAYPVTAHPAYAASLLPHRFWWQNGVWLDQGQSATCVGNAFAHRLADDPGRVGGIDEAFARGLYLAASGDPTYQQGTSGLNACRALMARGSISAYHWVGAPEELRNTVLALGTVCVGTDWFESMFTPVAHYYNAYLRVVPSSGVAGGHEYVVNAVRMDPLFGAPYYRIKNSWGRGWGHYGTARILCTDLEDLLFGRGGDAVLITEAAPA